MFKKICSIVFVSLITSVLAGTPALAEDLKVLFLGDNGHHKPKERFDMLQPTLEKNGIQITYSDQIKDLNRDTLDKYDALVIYANYTQIAPDQEKALLSYVEDGGGFVPLHCASACFNNSAKVVALIGGRFKQHGTDVMTTRPVEADHPILRSYKTFTSWDETYLHDSHNEANRTVLEYRYGLPQAEGNTREPWTWVRTQGKGRVFYTAWGHDERTWKRAGFKNLVERGIRWAAGQGPDMVNVALQKSTGSDLPPVGKLPENLKPFDYVDVGPKIPNYPESNQWGVQKENLTLMQQPVPAEESMKHMVLPEGFRVELFADESIFQSKPIAMTWDERGRLWVCETLDYPNELDENGGGRDRIRIISDTDGDGKADQSVIFAEKLSIPTTIAFHRGGAVVQNGTQTLYLKDTDGDDKADVRKVLMSNWALGDTHGGVSNFRNGLDNWIWGMQGYNNSAPIIEGVKQPSFRQGFFRFKLSQDDDPVVEKLEFVRSTTNNTWGLGISEEGLIFGSTANRAPSFFMPIANRYYERVKGWAPQTLQQISDNHYFNPITDKIRQVDQHGGYTAGAGHAIYTAREYPDAFWNRTAFVCGPTGKLVGTFELTKDGASFKSQSPINLLASDDEWTAPIMAEVGPDGNVWVLDWYNYIVQHNPTPQGFETGKGNAYESDLRDKKYGRVYRVVYGDSKVANVAKSAYDYAKTNDVAGLVGLLKSPTMLVRLSAQRVLVERQKMDCVPELLALLRDNSVDSVGLNVAAIHALQVLSGLGLMDSQQDNAISQASAALKHPSAAVRLNAIRVLPNTSLTFNAMKEAGIFQDSDHQVMLAALLKVSDTQSIAAGSVLAAAAANPMVTSDRWLSDALTSASAMHASDFLASLCGSTEKPDVSVEPIATRVAEHFARTKPPEPELGKLISAMAGNQSQTNKAILTGLSKGWSKGYRIELSDQSNTDLVKLFESSDQPTKVSLAVLSLSWTTDALEAEIGKVFDSLLASVESEDRSSKERLDAANQLISFDVTRAASADSLLELITPQTSTEFALGLIRAVAKSEAPEVGKKLAALASASTPKIREGVIRTLLGRSELTDDLLTAIEANELRINDLTVGQRASLRNYPTAEIKTRAIKLLDSAGAVVKSDRDALVQSKKSLTTQTGNPAAGKLVFQKNCATCHVFKGEGKVVGPNLNGMSVHPKIELLTHILDPNRSVEGNYRIYTVLTYEGLVYTGLLSNETLTTIEIVDSEGKSQSILREDIEDLKPGTESAMPEGFEQSINDEGFVNLLEYLTQHEKFIPVGLESVANVVTTEGMFINRKDRLERLEFDKWGDIEFEGVPFNLIDPQGSSVANAVMLYGPQGNFPPKLPASAVIRCRMEATKIHILGGVAGWASQTPGNRGTSMIVRLAYTDGETEDHPLIDGQHIADYIRQFEVPQSKLALKAKSGGQLRYLSIEPKRKVMIDSIELVKPKHPSAPLIMAITVEVGGAKANGH